MCQIMQAITVVPGDPASAGLSQIEEPRPAAGELLVETLRLGVCGTDREIVDGVHGSPPEGREGLVLGHELLGRVRQVPDGGGFEPGDLVAGIVRRPDPEPCPCCARGEWDMCRNGLYTERGIKEPRRLRRRARRSRAGLRHPGIVPSWASSASSRSRRACWPRHGSRSSASGRGLARCTSARSSPAPARSVFLAALMASQHGYETHVLDRAERGIKPELVAGLGASYHTGSIEELCESGAPEIIVECTGVAQLVVDAMRFTAPGAVVCLTGVAPRRSLSVDVGEINKEIVLENDVVFGSVNANRRHFDAGHGGTREGRPRLAWAARHPPGSTRTLAGGARQGRRTTSRSSSSSPSRNHSIPSRAMPTSLVTGGAGFLGSHSATTCLRVARGSICVDNLETGSLENIRHITNGADFEFLMLDITTITRSMSRSISSFTWLRRRRRSITRGCLCIRSRWGRMGRTTRSVWRRSTAPVF